MTEFFDAIKSPITKRKYEKRLDLFFRHVRIKGSTIKARARNFASKGRDQQWATHVINQYLRYQKERAEKGEISESTLPNYYKPIKLFCEENNIELNWKKISRRIPHGRSYADDRPPTKEEIIKILDYPDRRIRPAVLTMVSSGIRVGSWDWLTWGDIQPIENDGQIVAASMRAYDTKARRYYTTFITPEAYSSLLEYRKYRNDQGEKVSDSSPILRDLFHPDRGGRGSPHLPKRLKATGIKRMIENSLWATGVRRPLGEGKRRHEFQSDHGFRKYHSTTCNTYMNTLCATIIEGHDTGIKESYNKPKMDVLLGEYLKAVPYLTILHEVSPKVEPQRMEAMEEKISTLEIDLQRMRDNFFDLADHIAKEKSILISADMEDDRESQKKRRERNRKVRIF